MANAFHLQVSQAVLSLHAGGGQQGEGVIDGLKSLAGGGDQGQSVKELSDDKWGGK